MPYIGYFSLVKHTDEFILFDPVQFIRHGWIERNRVLKQSGGWQYIQVPLIKENGRDTLIQDIKINNCSDWGGKILAQLQHYKKIAPYYVLVTDLLKQIFSKEYNDIVSLNREALIVICNYLDIHRNFPVFSKMDLTIDEVTAPDEWALNICKAMGANEYLNPIGGTEFFDRTKYEQANISIAFQDIEITEYNQKRETFEPGLSIIDVLMFNTAEDTSKMLDKFTLV